MERRQAGEKGEQGDAPRSGGRPALGGLGVRRAAAGGREAPRGPGDLQTRVSLAAAERALPARPTAAAEFFTTPQSAAAGAALRADPRPDPVTPRPELVGDGARGAGYGPGPPGWVPVLRSAGGATPGPAARFFRRAKGARKRPKSEEGAALAAGTGSRGVECGGMAAGLGGQARALLHGRPQPLLRSRRRPGSTEGGAAGAARAHERRAPGFGPRRGRPGAEAGPGCRAARALLTRRARGPRDCSGRRGGERRHCGSGSILTGGPPWISGMRESSEARGFYRLPTRTPTRWSGRRGRAGGGRKSGKPGAPEEPGFPAASPAAAPSPGPASRSPGPG